MYKNNLPKLTGKHSGSGRTERYINSTPGSVPLRQLGNVLPMWTAPQRCSSQSRQGKMSRIGTRDARSRQLRRPAQIDNSCKLGTTENATRTSTRQVMHFQNLRRFAYNTLRDFLVALCCTSRRLSYALEPIPIRMPKSVSTHWPNSDLMTGSVRFMACTTIPVRQLADLYRRSEALVPSSANCVSLLSAQHVKQFRSHRHTPP